MPAHVFVQIAHVYVRRRYTARLLPSGHTTQLTFHRVKCYSGSMHYYENILSVQSEKLAHLEIKGRECSLIG